MIEQRMESRRRLIRTIVGGVSTGMLFRMPAQASDKTTRQQAQYQDKLRHVHAVRGAERLQGDRGRGQQGWLVQGIRAGGLV
jgi:hypothetical protein